MNPDFKVEIVYENKLDMHKFAKYQFFLFNVVFPMDRSKKSDVIIHKFEKCRKNNINAI